MNLKLNFKFRSASSNSVQCALDYMKSVDQNFDANTHELTVFCCYIFLCNLMWLELIEIPCVLFLLSSGQTNHRKGYMGHLTNVANSIVQSVEKGKNKATLDAVFAGKSLVNTHAADSLLLKIDASC